MHKGWNATPPRIRRLMDGKKKEYESSRRLEIARRKRSVLRKLHWEFQESWFSGTRCSPPPFTMSYLVGQPDVTEVFEDEAIESLSEEYIEDLRARFPALAVEYRQEVESRFRRAMESCLQKVQIKRLMSNWDGGEHDDESTNVSDNVLNCAFAVFRLETSGGVLYYDSVIAEARYHSYRWPPYYLPDSRPWETPQVQLRDVALALTILRTLRLPSHITAESMDRLGRYKCGFCPDRHVFDSWNSYVRVLA